MSRLEAGLLWNLGSIYGRDKRVFSSLNYPDQLWGPLSLVFNGYCGALSSGVK